MQDALADAGDDGGVASLWQLCAQSSCRSLTENVVEEGGEAAEAAGGELR